MKGYIARICTSFIDVPEHIAVAVYLAGCSIRCKDCHNKELWDKKSGKLQSTDQVVTKIDAHPLADSVVFVGGEPTDQMDFLCDLCSCIKDKQKVLYTGREFEVLPEKLLQHLNMIICGPYRSELHIGGWPASSNQRVFKREKESKWHLINTH